MSIPRNYSQSRMASHPDLAPQPTAVESKIKTVIKKALGKASTLCAIALLHLRMPNFASFFKRQDEIIQQFMARISTIWARVFGQPTTTTHDTLENQSVGNESSHKIEMETFVTDNMEKFIQSKNNKEKVENIQANVLPSIKKQSLKDFGRCVIRLEKKNGEKIEYSKCRLEEKDAQFKRFFQTLQNEIGEISVENKNALLNTILGHTQQTAFGHITQNQPFESTHEKRKSKNLHVFSLKNAPPSIYSIVFEEDAITSSGHNTQGVWSIDEEKKQVGERTLAFTVKISSKDGQSIENSVLEENVVMHNDKP